MKRLRNRGLTGGADGAFSGDAIGRPAVNGANTKPGFLGQPLDAVGPNGLDGKSAHAGNAAMVAVFRQSLIANGAIFSGASPLHNAAMTKDEYRKAIESLGRGAKAELARRLGKDGYFVSKMFGPKRRLRHDEVIVLDKFLQEHHMAELPPRPDHNNVTIPVSEVRQVDAMETRTVPLWNFVASEVSGGPMTIAQTMDYVDAPEVLKPVKLALSIDVWDDANSPQLPRGTTLYILRKTGRDGQWHVFGKPLGKNQTAVENPALGVLLGKLPHAWRVTIGSKDVELPIADYPAAWQVRQINY